MGDGLDIGEMDLVKKERRVEGRRAKKGGDHEPEKEMAQRLIAGPVARVHAGGLAEMRHGLRGAFLAQQKQKDRDAGNRDQPGQTPKKTPVVLDHKRDEDQRQQRLARSEAKG